MIELVITLAIVAAGVLVAYDFLRPRRPRHRWTEVDSADVAHAWRIRRRGR